jgi:hypothetical protein
LAWRKKASALNEGAALCALAIDVQKQLAAGYFEFSRERKAAFYRKAREHLAHLWVELDLLRSSNEAVEALLNELAGEVLGSLAGVLRKIERKSASPESSIL